MDLEKEDFLIDETGGESPESKKPPGKKMGKKMFEEGR